VALDLARERKGDDPAFDRMEHDFERLNEMIGRLLTVARLDSASVRPEMTRVDLGQLLSEVVADADFEARQRNCSVQLSCQSNISILANADLLRSAVENVVRNAIRYTAPNSAVEVSLQSRIVDGAGAASVVVRDHGPGVPESELAKIFRPFYRLTDARDRQSGGVGLGLAIADRVVRLHAGMISAHNASGDGLQVEITVPIAR
jgi:two-component system sensor histidine kinase CpxA